MQFSSLRDLFLRAKNFISEANSKMKTDHSSLFFFLLSSSGGRETNWRILWTCAASIRNRLAIWPTAIGPSWSSDFPWYRRIIWRICAIFRVPGGAGLSSYLPDSGVVFLSFGKGLLYFSTREACETSPEIELIRWIWQLLKLTSISIKACHIWLAGKELGEAM